MPQVHRMYLCQNVGIFLFPRIQADLSKSIFCWRFKCGDLAKLVEIYISFVRLWTTSGHTVTPFNYRHDDNVLESGVFTLDAILWARFIKNITLGFKITSLDNQRFTHPIASFAPKSGKFFYLIFEAWNNHIPGVKRLVGIQMSVLKFSKFLVPYPIKWVPSTSIIRPCRLESNEFTLKFSMPVNEPCIKALARFCWKRKVST